MDYSIPSDVKVIDLDGNGYADRMYVGDMGGQVWRFDVTNGASPADLIAGGVIAQLGAAPASAPSLDNVRRFYYAPDIAFVNNKDFNFIHIGIGSGHREHPLGTVNHDRFYALRDYNFGPLAQAQFNTLTPITDANLAPIVAIDQNVPQGSPGWKLELDDGGWNGEKVLAEARTLNNKVVFTTFRPSGSASPCEPQTGTNRIYEMSLFNGAPVTNLDQSIDEEALTMDDLFVEGEGGILSTTQVIFIEQDTDEDGVPDSADDDDDGDGIPDVDDPDDDDDGLADEVDDTNNDRVIRCNGLICVADDFNNAPVRTFWAQDGIE